MGSKLIWQTPTGAMLWEIWGQRKLNFAFHAAALLVSALGVWWLNHGASEITVAVLRLVLISCFLGAFLDLLTCFGYIEVDASKVRIGFPVRLLMKPVSTLRLALVPMGFGGAAVATVLWLWNHCILQPLGQAGALEPLWLGAVVLCLFWWMQALAWSLPLFPGRSLIMILVAVIHLLVGLLPLMPVNSLSGWQWPLLAVMLGSAVLTAWTGLKLMRQGNWEGPSWLSRYWSRRHPARTTGAPRKFGSAFGAQFWLEWRRQGWLLPGITGGILFVALPLVWGIQKQVGETGPGTDFNLIATSLGLLIPLVISGTMGGPIARFDQLQPPDELPVYITARPMTNGGFVVAKLAMALASSALTWLAVLVIVGVWLAVVALSTSPPKAATVSPAEGVAFVLGCVPLLLLLILMTWKNLIGGMAAGLTGRRWVIALFTFGKTASVIGLIVLVLAAKLNANFKTSLLYWLPGILSVGLVAKLVVAMVAFCRGWRRKAITARCAGWIIGGWSGCGLFVAGYGGLVCHALNQSDRWPCVALAGFLVLPLADLAIAPLALAWNRHR